MNFGEGGLLPCTCYGPDFHVTYHDISNIRHVVWCMTYSKVGISPWFV